MRVVRSVEFHVPSVWDMLPGLRRTLNEHLADVDSDTREDAVMVANELVENAVKYGHQLPGAPPATLAITRPPDTLSVRVSSGILNEEAARSTIELITTIRNAPDKRALYIERMRELLARKDKATRLGLFRIAAEAHYELDCKLDGSVLHVTATRSLS